MNELVCHFKVYKIKFFSVLTHCNNSLEILPETINYIKSKKFLNRLKNIILTGSTFDLNIAYIQILKSHHSYNSKGLRFNFSIAVSQKLNISEIESYLRFCFSYFNGTQNFSFNENDFCFRDQALEISEDIGKICIVKIFRNSRVLN